AGLVGAEEHLVVVGALVVDDHRPAAGVELGDASAVDGDVGDAVTTRRGRGRRRGRRVAAVRLDLVGLAVGLLGVFTLLVVGLLVFDLVGLLIGLGLALGGLLLVASREGDE